MRASIPVEMFTESIQKTVIAPKFFTLFLVEITKGLHRKRRRVRHRRQGRSRLDHSAVLLRRVSDISFHAIPGRQPPRPLAIAFVVFWIINTICAINEGMVSSLLSIIDAMIVGKIVGVNSHESIL